MKSSSHDVSLGCFLSCKGIVISNDRFLDWVDVVWGNVLSSDKFILLRGEVLWSDGHTLAPRKLVTFPCGYPVRALIMSWEAIPIFQAKGDLLMLFRHF